VARHNLQRTVPYELPLTQPAPQELTIATILRIEDGRVADHWEVVQDEASQIKKWASIKGFSSEACKILSSGTLPPNTWFRVRDLTKLLPEWDPSSLQHFTPFALACLRPPRNEAVGWTACCRLRTFLMETHMTATSPEQNKALVLKAFDTLFNKRDYASAERFWSDRYIQHSAHIPPGRDGLFNLVRGLPHTLRYENHVILAEGDYLIAHGRFSGHGRPAAWIAADIVRFEDGKLAEHWDVLQDEATQAESLSGLPMFGDRSPA